MSDTAVLAPQLNDIVNMQLSKKDLMEVLECDVMDQLEKTMEEAKKNYSILFEKYNSFHTKIKEEERSTIENRPETKKFIECMNVACSDHKDTKHKIDWNVYTCKDNGLRPEKLRATICFDVDGTYNSSTEGSLRFNIYLTKTESNVLEKLYKERKEAEAKAGEARAVVESCKENIINAPKKLKSLSASITKKALDSSDKGKTILKLLTQIRSEEKKEITSK